MGRRDLWPLKPQRWDEDTFYGLIEAFHDLVARPRLSDGCPDRRCIGHFSQFSTETGRLIYRWQVNHLLSSADDPFRLAITGEDMGRLVRAVDEARGDLVDRVTHAAAEDVARRVEHAISLFRRRDTTEHDKRSAVIALAGILEERRALERGLHPESINDLVHAATARAELAGGPYSAHSLRAGFVTYSHLRGASGRAIAHQTRHRSLATLGAYVRVETAWEDNAATQLGL
ncbi:hypothetical protein ACL02T_10175 [Pseudonocardia sp. RS010]|uniref:hypothetical protein n=1 Tax=Pseudonocardia sp. RS010 TaxID=3385979 RepID=UPI0039A24F2E